MPKSKLDHNIRLLEAETAYDMKIPFGDEWYSISKIQREYMIATKLASKWIDTLMVEDSVKHAK